MRRRPALTSRAAALVVATGLLIGAGGCSDDGDGSGDATVGSTASTTEAAPTTTAPVAPLPTGLGDPLFPDLGAPGIDVQHYDVDLTVSADLVASGTVTLTLTATEALARIAIDARSMDVSEVTLDGAPVEFALEEPELLVTPDQPVPAGDEVEVAVTYVDDPDLAPSADKLGPGWIRAGGYSYTLNEPEAARDWLPSLDHPSDKATWRFSITPPPGAVAVANGVLASSPDEGAGGPWVWEMDDPMATYLVQVMVGDLELVDGHSTSGVALSSAVLPDDRAELQRFLDLIDEQVTFYEGVYGDYPFATYGVAVVDQALGLALEQQGRSLFASDAVIEYVAAHELVHQWFGNLVTPERWGDIWLSESFATYGHWIWMEHRGQRTLDSLAEETLIERRAEPGPPTAEPTASELFGHNVYDGGALVVHALRLEIGDDAFWELLDRWLTDYAGESAGTDDFTALAEEVAGRDLDAFFDAWLYAAELPAQLPG